MKVDLHPASAPSQGAQQVCDAPAPSTDVAQAPSFTFARDGMALLASGVQQRITLPAGDDDQARDLLQRAIQKALDAARRAGQDKPMVVGALPFDPRSPSCLFVPRSWRWQPQPKAQPSSATGPRLIGETTVPDAPQFQQAVRSTLARIAGGDLQKAVLAACQHLHFDGPLDAARIGQNLRTHDAHGYHFSLPLPAGGTLLGASPELLVQKQDGELLLLPLAGSAPRHPQADADARSAATLQQSAKDQHEHALVVQDIAARLAPLCSALQVPEAPALLATPNVWHLATRIRGRLRDPATSVLQLACQLHPTPAICGTPTSRARDWIQQIEPFERGWYSGAVGWCDSRGDGQWALAIRCGIVQGNSVRLYAGAGIVAGSDPGTEWQEVHNKLSRMRRACGLAA